jgi:hypothetical protein
MINVKNRTCIFNDCNIQSCFNFKGEKKGLYCLKHKKENMVNIKGRTCLINNCDIYPCFNFQDEKKVYIA